MAAAARAQFQSDEAPTSLFSATTLLGPATVFVAAGLVLPLAILLRYSFDKVDARRIMIDTFSFDNYVKFFSDPYYTGVLRGSTSTPGRGILTACPSATPLGLALGPD